MFGTLVILTEKGFSKHRVWLAPTQLSVASCPLACVIWQRLLRRGRAKSVAVFQNGRVVVASNVCEMV